MRKAMVVGLVLVLMLLFITACGVPQEKYDKLGGDFNASQAQVQSLQGELTGAQTQIQSLQGQLTTSQAQVQSLQGQLTEKETQLSTKESELAAAQTQIQSLQGENNAAKAKLEQGEARVEILNDIMIPALTGELAGMTQSEQTNYFLKWRDKIIAVGDSTLTAKFQAIIDTGSNEASLNFFLYLLGSISKALGYSYGSSSGI